MATTDLLIHRSVRKASEYNHSEISKRWYTACNLPERLEPVSLLIAIRTADTIILTTDSLSLERDDHTGTDVPNRINKLHRIAGTDWIMVSVGNSGFDIFKQELEAEIAVGQRAPFDSHLSIGGPALLRALRQKAIQIGSPETGFPLSWVALAGFDLQNKPLILTANLPLLGYSVVTEPIVAMGAQFPTAAWILYTLAESCTSIETLRKLAVFTIWEMSKRELKIGRIEAGYPIHSCVMEFGKPQQFAEASSAELDIWLKDWEQGLRDCFTGVIEAMESKPKPIIPE